mmetsp:Transcript_7919/g.11469  ORF Transcript_7919/g.11469 Transcript_7919/m.11469 type:complete len:240 (-) Transcript_7919:78-797(-)
MKNLVRSLEELDASISKLRDEVHELKVKNKRSNLNNVSSRQQIQKNLDVLTSKIKNNRGSKSLTPYLQTIRSVMGITPTYVQSLEAKVCQALHLMAIGNDQFSLLDKDCHGRISELKSECIAMREETTNVTFDLMNQISTADDSNHTMRMAYLRILQAQCTILRALDMQVVTLTEEEDIETIDTQNAPKTPRVKTRYLFTSPNTEQNAEKDSANQSISLSSPTSVVRTATHQDQNWLPH